jgi:hypothetical protein
MRNSSVYHNFQTVDQKKTKKSGKNTFICVITLKSERIEHNISGNRDEVNLHDVISGFSTH